SFAFAAACAVIAGSIRLKSCSVSALEVAAGCTACATAGRTPHSTPATTSSTSSAMAERAPDAARSVLAEHRVLGVGLREGLLVFALHRRLHRGAERALDAIDQGDQVHRRIRNEAHAHACDAALCVRRSGHAAF